MARKGGPVEMAEYAQMVGRMVRALGRRGADGDFSDLAEIVKVQQAADEALRVAVKGMRETQQYSWAQIGEGLGIGRSAAQERFGR